MTSEYGRTKPTLQDNNDAVSSFDRLCDSQADFVLERAKILAEHLAGPAPSRQFVLCHTLEILQVCDGWPTGDEALAMNLPTAEH